MTYRFATQVRRWTRAGVALATVIAAGAVFAQGATKPAVICFGDPALSASSAITTSIPIQAGYYKANGLDVRIQPSASGSECALAVSSGHAFATAAGMTALLVAANKDPNLVIVAASYRYSWGVAVPEASPIKTIADLKGKAIGVQSLSSASYLFGKAIVNEGGIDADKDVQWLNVGLGATAANALQTNRVAAYATYNGVVDVVGSLLNTKMRWLPSPITLMQGNYGWLVRRSELKNNPEMVAGLLRGAFQGIVYANANPEEGLKLHLKQYPEQSNPATQKTNAAVLASRAEEQIMTDESGQIGYVSIERLQQTADFYVKNGLLANKVDVSKLADFSAIKSANDFDRQKIVASLK
ncbi:MAG: ABC transporter substrate-binding protein [Burkholderiales bacterium]|nr:ABC transporter substrate-binding protein [Burkholderiales bacterium]ODU68898.1 MAG: hypothetical protein ABT05_02485 [Lautropia sp. SCN 66-9]